MAGRPEVGHRLHKPQVHAEGVLDELLAVPRDGGGAERDPAPEAGINLEKLLFDDGDGVALIGGVIAVQKPAVFGDEDKLCGGAAGVDAQPGVSRIGVRVHRVRCGCGVPGGKRVVLRLRLEQGLHDVRQVGRVGGVVQETEQRLEIGLVLCLREEGRAQRGKAVGVFGEDGVIIVQRQRLDEALPEAHEEGQRPAQEDELPGELPALGEAGHRLVHHRLEDGGRDVLPPSALIEDWLDVRFGEHAAAGGDGVDLFMFEGEFVQLRDGDVQKRRHLVDEGAGAAGAGAVHPFLQAPAEEDDLRVLAAQLDDGVRIGDVFADGGGRGVDLLHEPDAGGLGHAEARRAGDDGPDTLSREESGGRAELLRRLLAHLGIVALIGAENEVPALVSDDGLDCGAADIDADV